jgi:hypothetical protein
MSDRRSRRVAEFLVDGTGQKHLSKQSRQKIDVTDG